RRPARARPSARDRPRRRAIPGGALRDLQLRVVGFHGVVVPLEHRGRRRHARHRDPRVGAVHLPQGRRPRASVRPRRGRTADLRGRDGGVVEPGPDVDRPRLRTGRRRLRRDGRARPPVMTAEVLARLTAELGDRVDTSPAGLEAARADKSGHASPGAPLAVVHAASIEDVQATLRIATETRTPVVTQGARTGLAGGANAGPGEIALSVRDMNRILEVRPDDLLAVVEPGILNADLNAALAKHGVWWPP